MSSETKPTRLETFCILMSMLLVVALILGFAYAVRQARNAELQHAAEYQPAGVWIEHEGKAYPVRIIESIREWPEDEPAPPPECSQTDPRWKGTSRVENGFLVLEPPEILRRDFTEMKLPGEEVPPPLKDYRGMKPKFGPR